MQDARGLAAAVARARPLPPAALFARELAKVTAVAPSVGCSSRGAVIWSTAEAAAAPPPPLPLPLPTASGFALVADLLAPLLDVVVDALTVVLPLLLLLDALTIIIPLLLAAALYDKPTLLVPRASCSTAMGSSSSMVTR